MAGSALRDATKLRARTTRGGLARIARILLQRIAAAPDEKIHVPHLRLDLRRGSRRAGRRHRAGNALGRRAAELDVPRMRGAQGGLRDGRVLTKDDANPAHDAARRRPAALDRVLHRRARACSSCARPTGPSRSTRSRSSATATSPRRRGARAHLQLRRRPLRARQRVRPRRDRGGRCRGDLRRGRARARAAR